LAAAGGWSDIIEPGDYTYVDITNGTYWIAVRDKLNPTNKAAGSVIVDCPEVATTTTTTTAAPTFNYYTLVLCGSGDPGDQSIIRTTTNLTNGTVVKISGFCYTVLNNTADANVNDVVITSTHSDCTECNATTTTTTTTAAPETTTTTTTTTTAAPTTTTTTTTLPPVSYGDIFVSCTTIPGETPKATLSVGDWAGGSGDYEITTNLYSSEALALAATAYSDIFEPGDYTYVNITNGTYWLAVRDKANTNNKTAKSVTVDCPEITTTTTTAGPTFNYYTLQLCGTTDEIIIRTETNLDNGTVVKISGFCYTVIGSADVNTNVVVIEETYNDCATCNASTTTTTAAPETTTTTTTTAAPTTTTTTAAPTTTTTTAAPTTTTTTTTTTAAPETTTTTTTTTTAAPETTTTTTTTAPETTTTTTAGPTYYYNNAYRNTCGGENPCTDDGVVVVLRSTQPLTNLSWYSNGTKSYQPYESVSGPSYYDLDIDIYFGTQADSCEEACNNYYL
jgi:hypothetical protein